MSTRAATHFSNDLRYRSPLHSEQEHLTPEYVLDRVRVDLGGLIGLDPCTTIDNPTQAQFFYTSQIDGLSRPWARPGWRPTVFVNPPYGKAREPWAKRCIEAAEHGQRVVLLIPAATDTRIWQQAVKAATAVVFTRGRLKFGIPRPNGRQRAASHPSSLIGFNTDLSKSALLGLRWLRES